MPELQPELSTVNDGDDYNLHRQLAVTPVSHSVSSSVIPPLSVPAGWIIQQVPRSNGTRLDTYYIDPETGRKFRSRYDIMRYLNPEVYQATKLKIKLKLKPKPKPLRVDYEIKNSMDRTMITAGESMSPRRNWITTKFTLPEDWFVEIVPRKSGNTSSDKYYYDPITGRKFRSLKDVERYLIEGIIPSKSVANRLTYNEKPLQTIGYRKMIDSGGQTSGYRKMIVSGGQMLDFEEGNDNQYQLVTVTPTRSPSTSHFKLPDGWIVEVVPRKSGNHCADRYYYEPGTGQKFRSKTAVQKHLAELEDSSPQSVVPEEQIEDNVPLARAFRSATPRKRRSSYASCKKRDFRKVQKSSFSNPPSKINWVVGSTEAETWNAFVGDTPVSDSLQQQWGEKFTLALNNITRNSSISRCGSTGTNQRLAF
uniref:methyl-CpG-binding domain-containing protein 7-like n=1 Tax=Erigeron canadensis TaxID=72917 RepID=UPI001CB9949D|nr:methyl-CpG-binding domain-containing protein 7-like [Erigeron canadensis]